MIRKPLGDISKTKQPVDKHRKTKFSLLDEDNDINTNDDDYTTDEISINNEDEVIDGINTNDEDDTINDSDSFIDTIYKARDVMTLLFKDIKRIHGDSVSKRLIFECASKAEITMKKITHKDYSSIVSNIKIEDLQNLMAQFTKTTNTFQFNQINNNSEKNILSNCGDISQKIVTFEATKETSQVAIFSALQKLHTLIELGIQKTTNEQRFNIELTKKLSIKPGPALSKIKRKCKRVNHIANILGKAGASLMANYIQVNFLENATPDEWEPILNELQDNQELVTFCSTLVLDNNEVLPIFPTHN